MHPVRTTSTNLYYRERGHVVDTSCCDEASRTPRPRMNAEVQKEKRKKSQQQKYLQQRNNNQQLIIKIILLQRNE